MTLWRSTPRVMQPHRFDEDSLRWMIDDRINAWLTGLLGREPYAVQTMFYFKPPGARGPSLASRPVLSARVDPGTCVAAWLAVDRCDEDNGCLQIVPGTQDIPVLCSVEADTNFSFTSDTVELPPGYAPESIIMEPGDMLFFNGQVVHGSFPNSSADRFRCAFIGPLHRRRSAKGRQMVSPPCCVWMAAKLSSASASRAVPAAYGSSGTARPSLCWMA